MGGALGTAFWVLGFSGWVWCGDSGLRALRGLGFVWFSWPIRAVGIV